MDKTEYLSQRIDEQINWMEDQSKYNQKMYKLLKLLEIIAAAAIPFLVGYHGYRFSGSLGGFHPFAVLTGMLGVVIVILTGMQQLYHYHENWLTYRTTIESLKREKFLYESGTEPYDTGEEAYHKFVINCEALLTDENNRWKINWTKREADRSKSGAA